LVYDINDGSGSSNPFYFHVLNGKLVFDATPVSNDALYVSDGTAVGTSVIMPFGTTTRVLKYSAMANGKLYFLAYFGTGTQLWQTDGTAAGTYEITQVSTANVAGQLYSTGNAVWFLAPDPKNTSVQALYRSDGTAAGTGVVVDLPAYSFPQNFVGSGGKLFFTADDPIPFGSYPLLWASDGTPAGTRVITDIGPAPYPSDLTDVNGTLFFQANDGVHGVELWRSDGTQAGTAMVQDINPGPAGSDPFAFVPVGNTLYLSANDGIHGNELMTIGLNGSISGTVFDDANNNGTQDSGEQGMPGVTVYLDLNHDGQFDSGDISTTTDANGNYSFQNLTPGTYTVREVASSGNMMTSPTGYSAMIPLALTQDATGPSFGNVNEASVTMNLAYFMALSRDFGKPGTFASGDANGDGTVNLADLLLVTRHFGKSLYVSPLIVTSTADDGSLGTLRYAIAHSNAGDTITFDPTVFAPGTSHAITLNGSQLEITHNLTISGPGLANLSVSGNNAWRVFQIDSGVSASISGLTITAGNAGTAYGGGINNAGTLNLANCSLTSSTAKDGGGRYSGSGSANLTNCTFSNDTASAFGGGLFNDQ